MKNQIIEIKMIVLLSITMMMTPGISHAGWFSSKVENTKARVQARTHTVATKVKAAPGNIKDRVEDISNKLNEIYSQVEANRPIMNKVKNGKMMQSLKEVVEFMQDSQEEYQYFANGQVDDFRRDIQDMLYDFGYIVEAFPAIENGDKIMDKLDKVSNLIDKIPSQFLFIVHKAVGEKLADVREKVGNISKDLASLPRLPKPRILLQDPHAYEVEMCKLVGSRANAVRIAVIKARLKRIIFTLKTITDYLPNDLTFNVTAVAGGGFTATKHPAQAPFQIPLTILEAVELTIDNNVAIANALCTDVVPKK
ncbi:MAG: hypothetical protein PVG20_06945 [Thioalkalispiraceae bacterium]